MQLLRYGIKISRVQDIFISHIHGDHVFGLPGLLTSLSLNRRTSPVYVYGPTGIKKYVDGIIQAADLAFSFPLQISEHPHHEARIILESDHLQVQTIPLDHRVPTTGYLFREKRAPRSMLGEAITKYGIPYADIPSIRQGADYISAEGKTIPNRLLTRPGKEVCSYAYCSDTAFLPSLVDVLKGVKVLYHESTFLDEHQDLATDRKHATASEAARIAREAQICHLILGHFSTRYDDISMFYTEASAIFSEVYIPSEGDVFDFERLSC